MPCGHATFDICPACDDLVCGDCIAMHACDPSRLEWVEFSFGDSRYLAPSRAHLMDEEPDPVLDQVDPDALDGDEVAELVAQWLAGIRDHREEAEDEDMEEDADDTSLALTDDDGIGANVTMDQAMDAAEMLACLSGGPDAPVTMVDVTETSMQPLTSAPSAPDMTIHLPLNAAFATLKQPDRAPAPVALAMRCMLWNIANLGGKFGYPKQRPTHTIGSIARIIHHGRPDFVSILEVLDRYVPTMPKQPVKVRTGGKNDVFDRIYNVAAVTALAARDSAANTSRKRKHGDDGSGARAKAEADQARTQCVTLFDQAVQYLVWHGKSLGSADPAWPSALHGVGQELESLGQAFGADNSIDHLIAEGYTHWGQKYKANYSGKEAKKNKALQDKDKTSKSLLAKLQAEVTKLWATFLQRALHGRLPAPKQITREEMMSAFNQLLGFDYDTRLADYEKRVQAVKALVGKQEKGEQSHDGLQEFFRIRDELNRLSGGAYDSWPDQAPGKAVSDIYTCGETYGILWRKDRLALTGAKVDYAGVHHGIAFSKREPLRIMLRRAGGPDVVFLPWHAPSPSASNAMARGKDFPSFMKVCEAERGAGRLSIVLSDLNIDTRAKDDFIEHCDPPIKRDDFFRAIAGAPLVKDYAHSTLVKTKIEKTEVDDLDLRLHDLASQRGLPGKPGFGSGAKLLEHIISFVPPKGNKGEQQKRTIQAHGASAYDKILSVAGASPGHRLDARGDVVVPFAQALAYEEELAMFPPEPLSGGRFPSFACLLERQGAPELKEARSAAKPAQKLVGGVQRERLLDLIKDARHLSDHLPLLADFVMRPLGKQGEAADKSEPQADQAPVKKPPEAPVESDLERLARSFETETDETKRSDLLMDLLVMVENCGDDTHVGITRLRIQRALDRTAADDDERGPRASTAPPRVPVTARQPGFYQNTGALAPIGNKGGGDCLFRALAQLIYGDQESHALIRTRLVAHYRTLLRSGGGDAPGEYGPEVDRQGFLQKLEQMYDWHQAGWPNAAPYSPRGMDAAPRYLLEMARPGVWGDLMMLSLASHYYKLDIKLLVRAGNRIFEDRVNFCAAGAQVAIYNANNLHFEACTRDAQDPVPLLSIDDPTQPPADGPAKPPTPQLQSTFGSGNSSSRPVPGGPVFWWPCDAAQDFWDIPDAQTYRNCIFVFGENHEDRDANDGTPDTQANIRGQQNAFGIRTCLKPGADPAQNGAMLDAGFDDNKKMIDFDVVRIKSAIDSKAYRTLVLPWYFYPRTSGDPPQQYGPGTALGTGIAMLPSRAPKTFAYLKQAIDGLMHHAFSRLPKLCTESRQTGAQRSDAQLKADTLFIFEDCQLLRDTPPTLDQHSVSLRGLPNALGIRTSRLPVAIDATGWLTDGDTGVIDADIQAIHAALGSGRFKRLSLPWRVDSTNATLVGSIAQLDKHAPGLHAYLKTQVAHLLRTMAAHIEVEDLRAHLGHTPADRRWEPVQDVSAGEETEERSAKRRAVEVESVHAGSETVSAGTDAIMVAEEDEATPDTHRMDI